MGNDYSFGAMGYDGIDRSGWKEVSDRAYRALEEAKDMFRNLVKEHSFDNVPDPKYKFTRKQAINFHLVGSLRPKFNKYVKSMGGKATWKVIPWEQKKKDNRYKNRKSAVYFCDITIDRSVRKKMKMAEPQNFRSEDLDAEISMFTFLTQRGVPESEATGWLVTLPKGQRIEQIPKIDNLAHYLDRRQLHWKPRIPIEKTPEFVSSVKKKKVAIAKSRQSLVRNVHQGNPASQSGGKRPIMAIFDLCSDSEGENQETWKPPLHKRQRFK